MTALAVARGLRASRDVLPNGLTVIAKETHTTPAVTLHASVLAGGTYEPPEEGGLAHFLSRTIDRGTALRTADEIAEDLDSRGVTLSVSANRHMVSLVCTSLVEDFDAILALLAEIITTPTFPAAEVETRRGEIVTLIRQDDDNPAAVASQAMMAALYGGVHPYGRPLRGTLDSVDRVNGATLQRFHARRFVPAAMSLAVVGDIAAPRAIAAAAEVFGGWKGAPLETGDLPAIPDTSGRVVQVVPMMNKAQADIAYGFRAIRRSDPRYYAYWLMNNILGQYALGGRLGDSIRERQGMAYYVSSSLDASLIRGPLVIRAGVNPANVERAVASIDAELSTLAGEGPMDKEITESKQYLIGSMPRNLETNLGIATFLQAAEFFGLGLDYDLRMPDRLRAITRDEVHAAARELLDPSSAAIAVAGPYDGTLR